MHDPARAGKSPLIGHPFATGAPGPSVADAPPRARLRARPGVLVADVFIGLVLLAVALTAVAVALPLWVAAVAVVGLLTGIVHGVEWALVRAGALQRRRLSPPLWRVLDRLLHPLPPRPPEPTPDAPASSPPSGTPSACPDRRRTWSERHCRAFDNCRPVHHKRGAMRPAAHSIATMRYTPVSKNRTSLCATPSTHLRRRSG